ncbi:MAG: hypothetical protein N2689_02645 [Verrucomicrobiae bacterium]|nr:hypothetical protein [Verrucomicrobiae bacterium]
MRNTATVPLPTLRQQLAGREDPILRAIAHRRRLPFDGGLYAENGLRFGMSRFEFKLYGRELRRALAGDYTRGERPLGKLWLPRVKRSLPNLTQDIRQAYVSFLREICPPGDDPKTYDAAFVRDLDALWFLSERIHEAGTSVGRTKLENADADADTLAAYEDAIGRKDVPGLMALLRDKEQEDAVTVRVRSKAIASKLDPDVAEYLFRTLVFPLTLKAEALDLILASSGGT